jgi:membrane protease YdiL (CAAX protease family)
VTGIGLFWNADERRPRAGWRVVIFQVVFWAGYVALGRLVFDRVSPWLEDQGEPAALLAARYTRAIEAVWAVSLLALSARWLDRRPMADYGRGRPWPAAFLTGTVCGLVLHSAPFLVSLMAGGLRVAEVGHSGFEGVPFALGLASGLADALCIGVWEEVALRGHPVRNLAEGLGAARGGPALTLAASGLVFALAHYIHGVQETPRMLFLLGVGVFLATAYYVTGSLAFVVGYHAAADAVSLHLLPIDTEDYSAVLLEPGEGYRLDVNDWYVLVALAGLVWLRRRASRPGFRSPLSVYRPRAPETA